MSYSRWSNSVWYTYWLATDSKVRDEQMFDVCGVMSFTFSDVTELGLDGMIQKIKNWVDKKKDDPKSGMFMASKYTDEEWDELKGYIELWYNEVKEEFDTPSQKYRDGKIPLDEAFIEEI